MQSIKITKLNGVVPMCIMPTSVPRDEKILSCPKRLLEEHDYETWHRAYKVCLKIPRCYQGSRDTDSKGSLVHDDVSAVTRPKHEFEVIDGSGF
jgi:hypothetical protein